VATDEEVRGEVLASVTLSQVLLSGKGD